jgi:type IV pilus assembly protein PilE
MRNMTFTLPARRAANGFTLIEVMIVVAIVSVLAAVAYPTYTRHTLRANRSNAQAVMMETAQFMERYYSANNTYLGAALVSAVVPKGASGTAIKYNVTFSVTPTASAYTVQAAPANSQAGDTCGTMTVTQTGAQSAAATGCW